MRKPSASYVAIDPQTPPPPVTTSLRKSRYIRTTRGALTSKMVARPRRSTLGTQRSTALRPGAHQTRHCRTFIKELSIALMVLYRESRMVGGAQVPRNSLPNSWPRLTSGSHRIRGLRLSGSASGQRMSIYPIFPAPVCRPCPNSRPRVHRTRGSVGNCPPFLPSSHGRLSARHPLVVQGRGWGMLPLHRRACGVQGVSKVHYFQTTSLLPDSVTLSEASRAMSGLPKLTGNPSGRWWVCHGSSRPAA